MKVRIRDISEYLKAELLYSEKGRFKDENHLKKFLGLAKKNIFNFVFDVSESPAYVNPNNVDCFEVFPERNNEKEIKDLSEYLDKIKK